MPLLLAFDNFRDRFETGYFPNMTTATSSYIIPSRPDNKPLYDLHRDSDSVQVKISDIERWYHRLNEAIDNGFCFDVGFLSKIYLKTKNIEMDKSPCD